MTSPTRRLFTSILGATVALLLAAGGALAASPLPASADPAGGGLTWGLKASWRAYVPADKQVPGGGATKDSAGLVTFPVDAAAYDAATGTTEVRFSGSMHYQNWCGLFYADCALDLLIENPRIVIDPDEQTLYATVHSRARTGAVEVAPPIIDYGEIVFARLDSAAGTVSSDGATTTWSGILAALAPEAVPTIGYDAGTALDDVSFTYQGDGGRPVVDESWAPPGTRLIEETARWIAPTDEISRLAAHGVYVDDRRGVVHLISQASSPGTIKVQAFDADTLAPLASAVQIGSPNPSRLQAFDPVTGTVLVTEIVSGATRLSALSYDAAAGSYSRTTVSTRPGSTLKSGTWDPIGNRLVTIEARTTSGVHSAEVVTWSFTEGAWTSETFPLPAPPSSNYYSGGNDQVLAVAADGSLILGRFGEALRIVLGDGRASISPIVIDSEDENVGHNAVVTGADGSIWISAGSESYITRFVIDADGTIRQDGERLFVGDTAYAWGAVDPADGTLWLKSPTASEMAAVAGGSVVYRHVFPGLERYAPFTIGAGHTMFTTFRSNGSQSALARLDLTGVSPTITTSPASIAVGAGGSEAVFTAAATGTPAPAVQWQAKSPGASRFSDIAGAVSPSYSTPVSTTLNGTQYRAVFTNAAGAIATDAATLTVLSAPTIVQQPLGITIAPGTDAQFQVLAGGTPEPAVTWQELVDGVWVDAVGEQFVAEGGELTVVRAVRSTELRAVASNDLGEAFSDTVTLTVAPVTVGEDGSVTGLPNAAGAQTSVKPGIEVPILDDGALLRVSGAGFTKNTNDAGVYALFGYVTTPPSAGGSAGAGYDFLPGGGGTGQLGQLFIAWPGNEETGGEANGRFSSVTDGEFAADGLVARTAFTGQSGARVDCLDGSVVCGVLTIGAHGGRDAALETFTPVFFTGQKIPDKPGTPPAPPTVPTTPVAPAEEGSLTWGVKSSFRNYIVSPTAKGAITLSGGAFSAGGGFGFGQVAGQWDPATGLGAGSYGGSVRFTGHGGILDLTLSDPQVRIDSATSATLLVSANGSRIAIGAVDLASASRRDFAGGVAYSGAPVSLTGAGAGVFAYGSSQFYPAGTAMDPVSFVIGAASTATGGGGTVAAFASAEEWTPPPAPPATTGIQGDPAELSGLRAGQQVTVWADGFQPGEKDIKVVIYSQPMPLDLHLAADGTGRATWTGTIPTELEPGKHTLTFQGSVNRGIVLTVAAAQQACAVQTASLTWGFKESFRSYISGTIANGEWTVADGASYSTPEFAWRDGSGDFDPEEFGGTIEFAGSIRFTGHDGLLDTTIANPRLRIVDAETAYLQLDVSGPTMDAALNGTGETVDARAVSFVELDLAAGTTAVGEDGTITVTGVPTAITDAGYAVFPNYEPGTAFDPLTFTVTPGSDCVTTTAPADAADGVPTAAAQGWPWWILPAALVAIALVIAAVVILVLRRRRAAVEG